VWQQKCLLGITKEPCNVGKGKALSPQLKERPPTWQLNMRKRISKNLRV